MHYKAKIKKYLQCLETWDKDVFTTELHHFFFPPNVKKNVRLASNSDWADGFQKSILCTVSVLYCNALQNKMVLTFLWRTLQMLDAVLNIIFKKNTVYSFI